MNPIKLSQLNQFLFLIKQILLANVTVFAALNNGPYEKHEERFVVERRFVT
jgi:hypothetical protein